MRLNDIFTIVLFSALLAGCGGGGTSSASANTESAEATGGNETGSNVLAITINDPTYPNKPTVSVTVCTPGTSNCQTINNILLDTGSYGLRVFKQALPNVSLPQINVAAGSLAECITYADGFGDWGPVKSADVVLGGETALNVSIQVIDSIYSAGAIPASCQSPNVIGLDQDPGSAGYNGILGVGLFANDCGQGCTSSANNGIYFTCSGSRCVGATVPLSSQVQNPVALLKQDNNGVIVKLPSVPLGGMQSVNGQLILGIGTRSNNSPVGVIAYPADINGEFSTVFNGTKLPNSFIDSGSNGLFFNAPSLLLPLCSSPDQDWYCPQSVQTLSATTEGAIGSPSGSISFHIGNTTTLFNDVSKSLYVELGGSAFSGSGFDWGLPFFFGHSVFVGIDGKSSILGDGPYWAY